MTNGRRISVAIVLLLLAGISLRAARRSPVTKPRASESPPPTAVADDSHPAVTQPERHLQPPSLTAVASEVKENPEITPPSLLAFAQSLGEKMTVALHSEPAATELFAELETCVTLSSAPLSTRALCLEDARRLADGYAGLLSSYQSLRDASDDGVKKLARFAELGR